MKSFNKHRTIPDPNEVTDKRNQLTRFHLAIINQDDLAISVMLKQGANLNKTTKAGTPPLSLALELRHDKIAQLICDEAISRGVDTLKSVINQKADNVKNPAHLGQTPIFFAVEFGQSLDFVKTLIDLGANLNIQDMDGFTVMNHAIQHEKIDAIKCLSQLGHMDLNPHTHNDRDSYITHCIDANRFESLKTLIDLGANMNIAFNTFKNSDIMLCLRRRRTEMFYYMLAHGADIMIRDEIIQTSALHLSYSPEITETLLERGAKKYINDFSTSEKATPVIAILENHKDTASAQILLDAGANMNDKNANGYSLMHYAAYLNDIDFFENLVLKGAYNDEKNDFNDTPLVCAVEAGALHITKRLISLGADKTISGDICETDLLGVAAQSGNVELGRFLIEELGFDVNKKNLRNQTALMTAAYYNHKDFLNLLLEHKADASALDDNASSALHYTAKTTGYTDNTDLDRKIEIAEILIKNGASVHQKSTDKGEKPYDVSISHQGYQSLILYLEKETYPSGRGGWKDLRFA